MKILNTTYRDIRENEALSIQKTPISQLDETSDLPEGSLIHVVLFSGNDLYESKKMTTDAFKQKMYESVQNTLKTSYWDTHEKGLAKHTGVEEDEAGKRPKGTSFADLLQFLEDKDKLKERITDFPMYVPEEVTRDDPANGFVNHVYYDFDILKRYAVLRDNDLQSGIDNLNIRVDELDCYFATSMELHTTKEDNNGDIVHTNKSVNHSDTENDKYCQMSIASGNKISNEWTCNATGNLVVYGWLDSSSCLNNKATPSAFCVLEGKINDQWEIISACSVTPAKNITYVGFNVLVKKDLVIRARTGFVCGVKSGQFPNQQDGYDTLANSTANGFKCMIYSNKDYSEREGLNDNDNS